MQETIEGFPLSPQQRRLWELQAVAGKEAFPPWLVILIEGQADSVRIRDAVEQLISRHEILRTTYRCLSGMRLPLQVITEADVAWPPEEVVSDSQAELNAALECLHARSIEAEQAGLSVSSLILTPERRLLSLSLPPMCVDRKAFDNLVRDLERLYAGTAEGAEDGLIQYVDLAEWQNELLASADTVAGRDYWRQQKLSDFSRVHLPLTGHSTSECFRPRARSVSLETQVVASFERLAADWHLSEASLLLACWQAFLGRLTGVEKLVVGTLFDGRKFDELHDAIGVLARYLPMTVDSVAERSFRQLSEKSEILRQELMKWQEYYTYGEGFDQRTLGGAGRVYFPFCFSYHTSRSSEVREGIRFSHYRSVCYIDRFEIELSCIRKGDRLSVALHYDSEVLDGGYVECLAEELAMLARSAVECPEAVLGGLRMVGESEERRQVVDFNLTAEDWPRERRVHRLFERYAAEKPHDVALVYENEELTYGELNGRANQLASHLRSLGVGPEIVVALHLERSLEQFVGLLAILKAGGAYMPLDPALPKERVLLMLEESGAEVVLTAGAVTEALTIDDRIVDLVNDAAEIERRSSADLTPAADDANLAYVLFTSGSTGHPKAVAVEHRQLVNYSHAILSRLALDTVSSYASVTSLGTDLGNTMIFSALCSGGQLHVISEQRSADPDLLADYSRRHAIDCLKIVPSHLAALIGSAYAQELMPRKCLLLGGEAATWELVARLQELAPATRLLNHYGPTEATIGVTTYDIAEGASGILRAVPLGRPLPNSRVYLLDSELELNPLGLPAELCIAGANLARGYLGRPASTAERFVPDPSGGSPGGRLYRSGDLARYRLDGTLEFLGRIDQQLKIHGFRVEPGEVEVALEACPAVEQAAVVGRPSPTGEPRLLAYAVPDRRKALPIWQWLHLEDEGQLQGRVPYVLPNGAMIAHLSEDETRFLYREIFEKRSCPRHGIAVSEGACIFDVGAHIGLFTLFAAGLARDVKVHAFEPAPQAAEVLRINAALYGLDVEVVEIGLSREEGRRALTYYPHAALMSSFDADHHEEHERIRAFLLAEPQEGRPFGDRIFNELLEERTESWQLQVSLRRLSDVIRERKIERIDLLKVSVHKGELEVLEGIDENDWPRIQQIVLSAHDLDCHLDRVNEVLTTRGFELEVERAASIASFPLFTVYARRPSKTRALAPKNDRVALSWCHPSQLERDLRDFLQARLPDHMMPARIVLLSSLPRTPSGKIDRTALPEPRDGDRRHIEVPRTPAEEVLAEIWAEVLGLEKVGVGESFFDLGGHSLLAAQAVSRIRHAFGVELPLRQFLQASDISDLAGGLDTLRRGGESAMPPLDPVSRDRDLPLSFGQQRLWFLHQMDPESSAYNLFFPVRLRGDFDPSAFAKTCNQIVYRHEVLRTVYAAEQGRPVQRIQPPSPVPLPMIDLSELPGTQRERVATRLVDGEHERPFDLAQGPMLRTTVLRLGVQDHVGLFTMHHIASDEWSMVIIEKEVEALYLAFSKGRSSALPALSIQYADYASWQQRWLSDEVLSAEIEFWKEKLAGLPPLLELPTDRPRPAVQGLRGKLLEVNLGPWLSDELRHLGRKAGTTLFTTILTGFKVLLHRYTQRTDICVGTPVAGRRHLATENVVGFFINTLVLRTDLSADPSFRELMGRVRDVFLEADLHQDLPFEKLVEELQPERSRGYTPLFQVVFNFRNVPGQQDVEDDSEIGITTHAMKAVHKTVHFDLTLTITEDQGTLFAALEYDTDLFDASTILRMAKHLQNLLTGAVVHPDWRSPRLPLLASSEALQLIREWNDTAAPFPGDRPIHELLAFQAERCGEAAAVVWSEGQMSYGELERWANRFARYLRGLGVGPETVVGLLLERSPELLVSILGVLKAGGAFLALDLAYPRERLEFMLQDSGAAVLVTASSWASDPVLQDLEMVQLDAIEEQLVGLNDNSPAPAVEGSNLAYVFYTSGSTGRPKGVMVGHRPLVSFAFEMARQLELGDEDRMLQFASPGFDVLIEEVFPIWLRGGTVVLEAPDSLLPPAQGVAVLERLGVTVMELPAPYWHEWTEQLETAGVEPPACLRLLLLGSEKPLPELLSRWQRYGIATIYVFGLTETAVTSSLHRLPEGPVTAELPIGRPIANSRLYLLGTAIEPVPFKVAGELYIGGAGLARGYLGRPALTAERFVPDPLSGATGARLYRTGDLARYRTDGNLDFLGRIDRQVKVRGFRIEPGEIEAELRQYPGIGRAVVMVRDDRPGDRRLVAYVVAEGNGPISWREVRFFLSERLPEYMVPSAMVTLETFPTTSHGKVDHRALPAPREAQREFEETYVVPRTAVEEKLAALWAEVLGLERVGIDDNFFELGGHSLLAVQIVARVRETLGIELPVFSLFEAPTIGDLAPQVERETGAETQEIEETLALLEEMSDEEARRMLMAHDTDDGSGTEG